MEIQPPVHPSSSPDLGDTPQKPILDTNALTTDYNNNDLGKYQSDLVNSLNAYINYVEAVPPKPYDPNPLEIACALREVVSTYDCDQPYSCVENLKDKFYYYTWNHMQGGSNPITASDPFYIFYLNQIAYIPVPPARS